MGHLHLAPFKSMDVRNEVTWNTSFEKTFQMPDPMVPWYLKKIARTVRNCFGNWNVQYIS